jgi:hypothetical protein
MMLATVCVCLMRPAGPDSLLIGRRFLSTHTA